MFANTATLELKEEILPQCEALFDFGISKISGMTIGDAEKMRKFIRSNTPGTPYVFGTPFMMRKK